MQTSGSSSSSPAQAPHAAREPATARRAPNREDDGAGDATIFSDLVAEAGAQLDAQSPDSAAAGALRGKDKSAEPPNLADPAGSALAAGPMSGLIPGTASAHQTLHPALHPARRAGAGTADPRAAGTGSNATTGMPGAAASAASAANLADGTTVATTLAATTAARDSADRGPDAAASPTKADGGRPATALQGQAATAATALPGPAQAAQAALQAAMREASGLAPELTTAAARAATAASGADAAGGDRATRARRGGPEAVATGRSSGTAARDSAVAINGTPNSLAGSLTANASGRTAASEAPGGSADSEAGQLPSRATGADPSVFALTMNQATAGSAATRTEPAAGLAGGSVQVSIDVPFDHGDFADAFARQSANLVIQGSNQAEIRLNPRDMGPIRIAISLDANAASLDIEAAHPDTRAAIEASMPALRQMLADQGLRLADYRVDSQSTGDRQQQAAGDPGRHDPGRHAHHADGSQSGSQLADGGRETGDASAQALVDGFGSGRNGHATGGHPADRHAAADRQGAPGPLGPSTQRPGAAGNPSGAGNSRIDLYA